jgi:hypothetical protein
MINLSANMQFVAYYFTGKKKSRKLVKKERGVLKISALIP